MPPKRMSSRELREKMSHDPLVDTITGLRSFWGRWKNWVVWGLVGAVVVYFAVQMIVKSQREHVQTAFNQLATAEDRYVRDLPSQQDEAQRQATMNTIMQSLNGVIEGFDDTAAAPMARYRKGMILMEEGDYHGARREFDALVQSRKETLYLVLGRMGRAAATASLEPPEGGVEEGVQQLRALLQEYPTTSFRPQIQFQLGRLLESQGKTQEALEQYRAIDEDSPWQEEARERIRFLEAPVVLFDEPGA